MDFMPTPNLQMSISMSRILVLKQSLVSNPNVITSKGGRLKGGLFEMLSLVPITLALYKFKNLLLSYKTKQKTIMIVEIYKPLKQ